MEKRYQRHLSMIKNQTGASLVFALIVSFMLIMLVTVTVHFSNTELISAKKQEHQVSAYYIAEAGIERAIHGINESLQKEETPETFFEDPNFEGGSYNVSITPKENEHEENIGFEITSIGLYEGEEKKITQWVRQPIWPPGDKPKQFEYAMFAGDTIDLWTLSSLLHLIKLKGDAHGNNSVKIKHLINLHSNPVVTGNVSSTNISQIDVQGLSSAQKKTEDYLPQPEFDFDLAREEAKENGVYIPHGMGGISLLGLSPGDKVVFIDGDFVLVGLDLLSISLMDLTIVVNGSCTIGVSLGSDADEDSVFPNTKLNIIAKEDIFFGGLLTGMQVNGILYSQKDISVYGHLEVDGYIGAKNITVASELLGDLTGVLTGSGSVRFEYREEVFNTLPSNIGFKRMYVEPTEQGSNSE